MKEKHLPENTSYGKASYMLDRRSFLKGLSAAGIMPVIPLGELFMRDERSLTRALIRVMNEQGLYDDYAISLEQINNLRYACKSIKPSSHQELAFVVACGMSHQPLNSLIDEYVRRKNGFSSKLPDHEMLALKEWGLPDTHRILIFKEQIKALIKNLIWRDNNSANEEQLKSSGRKEKGNLSSGIQTMTLTEKRNFLYYGSLRRSLTYSDFFEALSTNKQLIGDAELKKIYDALLYYGKAGCRPYAYCSTMAERATIIAG